jgi:hypothetical protein
MNSRLSIRLFLAIAVTSSLVFANELPFANQLAFNGFTGAAANDLNLKSESQLKSEAALYDTAIRELGRITSMRLANPDESKTALAIINRQRTGLRFMRSKLIVMGLNESTFAAAVRVKTSNDTKTAQEFAVQLAQNRTDIFKLAGAASLKDQILSKIDSDTSLMRKIAEQLKQAAAEIKANVKGHHTPRVLLGILNPARATSAAGNSAPPVPRISDKDVANLLIVAAVIVFPPLGIAIGLVAANLFAVAIAEAIVAVAVVLLGELKKAAGSNQEKAAIDNCQDKADDAYNECLTAADNLVFPLNVAAGDACYGAWLLNYANCYLL